MFCATGSFVKVISCRTGKTIHVLRACGSDDTICGYFINKSNARQIICATQSGAVVFFDVEDGVLLKTIHLKTPIHRMIQAPDGTCIYASQKSPGNVVVFSWIPQDNSPAPQQLFTCSDCTGLAVSGDGNFVSAWAKTDIVVHDARRNLTIPLSHPFTILAVAFHPRKPVLALGDRRGKINILHALESNGKENADAIETLHWHAHGVYSLLFCGEDGNVLLSGGEEDALVQWQLDTRKKLFVPHLGSLGLYSVACSGNGRILAALCGDNSLFIITAHDLRVSRRILGLRTLGPNLMRTYTRMMSSPSNRQCLVFSGRPNTLQWYNLEQDVCAFELEVLHGAAIARGRPPVDTLAPSRVEYASFGKFFLGTLDVRTGNKKFKVTSERTLKFWKPKRSGFGFELACMVLRPHHKRLTCLAASSVTDEFVTSSHDNCWKLWRLFSDDYGATACSCVMSNSFKDMKPTACCFSNDGSIICVAYEGSLLTLWDAKSGDLLQLASTAAPHVDTVALLPIPSTTLLVGVSKGYLWTFDLISCSIVWRIQVDVIDVAAHWSSGHIAFVTPSWHAVLIHASSPQPLWSRKVHTDSLRVQFVQMSERADDVHVAVMTKAGAFLVAQTPQVVDPHALANSSVSTPSLSEKLAPVSTKSDRFQGLLGQAGVAGQAQPDLVALNQVRFPPQFLPETASHVLPSSTVMLTALMSELMRKPEVPATTSSQPAARGDDLGVLLGVDEDRSTQPSSTKDVKEESMKMPHHFGSDARNMLASYFEQNKA